ncbi:ATP-binding protein [Aquabacterium sp. J223]|uniref:ATP-binding protein n=1 Tax=Aquabacterium sp. J223 TaxID=2898431 RepID=UPI0021ADB769|nr:ATP-binding protein [Aquabacterium sp. J223]UUX95107.1 ATP-binding protein [Aquabacterium sp. J223]
MSIRTRLLLLVLAVWLPAAAGFGALAWSTYQREVAGAREAMANFGRSLRLVIEAELDQRAAAARTLAGSQAVRDADLARFHQEASAALVGTRTWALLATPTEQLANTLRPVGSPPLRRAPQAPWLQEGTAVFFAPVGPAAQKPVITVLAAVRADDGGPTRFNVGVVFEPALLQDLVDAHARGWVGLVSVVNERQLVMSRSRDPEKWLGQRASDRVLPPLVARRSDFVASTTLDGVRSLTFVSSPTHQGWAVLVSLPQAMLDASARRLTLQACAAAAGLLAIGLLAAWLGSRRIVRPVLALRDAAVELGRDAVPAALATGVTEADQVSLALHEAGRRAQEATQLLESRVAQAVQQAEQAQARLLDAQKHEAIGRLTGGLAHDFNNLLQTIRTGLQVLDRGTHEPPQRRVLEAALRATGKAAELVRHMLAFGRTQPAQARPVDLHDFMLKGQELMAKAVEGRARLHAHIDVGLPPVMADPTQLELALLNLVFNARDAMPAGGDIQIRARLATDDEVPPGPPGRFVCVQVADTGAGMDAATLQRVFEPYFTTKPVGAGSGLGLAQVQSFAREAGGEVRVHSVLGQGSRISLTLPVADVPAPVADTVAPPLPVAALHVLVVEDDPLVASVVVSALEGAGHRCVAVGSADEAVLVLSGEQRFDVVFTDVAMPGRLNGMQLAALCRGHRPPVPVVVASGYTTEALVDGVQMLRKPYGTDELLAALQAAVTGP